MSILYFSDTKYYFIYWVKIAGPPIRPNVDNTRWTADNSIRSAKSATSAAKGNGITADTFSWFCNSGGGGVAGIAYLGTLCDEHGWNVNLNERQWSNAATGFVSY